MLLYDLLIYLYTCRYFNICEVFCDSTAFICVNIQINGLGKKKNTNTIYKFICQMHIIDLIINTIIFLCLYIIIPLQLSSSHKFNFITFVRQHDRKLCRVKVRVVIVLRVRVPNPSDVFEISDLCAPLKILSKTGVSLSSSTVGLILLL